MNTLFFRKMLSITLFSLWLSTSTKAKTMSDRYQMNPGVEQAIGNMRSTQSNSEVLQVLSTIQDRTEQTAQVILASISVVDLEQRNEIVAMLFKLSLSDDGLNSSHIPLLVQLYVKTVQSAPMPFAVQQQRSFIKNGVLTERLLRIIASLLDAESIPATLPPGKPLPRLLNLLEAVHDLSLADSKMIEDAINVVKKGIENGGGDDMPTAATSSSTNPSMLKSPEPTKLPKSKSTASSQTGESSAATTPWSIVIASVMAMLVLLILQLKQKMKK